MADGVIRLHGSDNVVIALQDLSQGAVVGSVSAPLPGAVPRGHKIATQAIAKGDMVIRYGQIIGQATADIPAGAHIHSHNLGMGPHSSDYAIGAECRPLPALTPRSFMGYHRPDGTVGTRNYLGILTSVNCSGSVARFIAEAAEKDPVLNAIPGIDGVVPIVHSTGCGMSGTNEGYQTLMRTLKGYARNANFGGILLVGLGCEVNQIAALLERGVRPWVKPWRVAAPDVLATAMAVGKKIGKVAVVAGVCDGFIGNRMLSKRQQPAMQLLLEGATPAQIDKVHTDFGMPMGPFQMSDLAGLDIGWHRDPSRVETIRDALCA
ncbi:MAG: hypothetical protein EAZ40_11440, partial [Rhodobacterales bacterium]